ncbi:MAG: hypothetical protein ACREPF_04005 [Rhodanobacteraceae bacterium]
MPRNDALQIEAQAQAPDRGGFRNVAIGLPELPYVRLTQRVPPPRDRRGMWLLLALVLLAHALLGWLGWRYLWPVLPHAGEGGAIAVTVIEPTPALPPPPPLVAPPPLPGQPAPVAPPAPPPPRVHYEAPVKGAISATLESSKGKPLDLYNPNGQIRLAPTVQPPASAPAYRAPEVTGSHISSGKSPVPYNPTRFSKDFEPTNQSLGEKTIGRALNKAIEKTTVQKTIKLPGGIKVHCAASPLLIFAGGLLGCSGEPPPPPPKNDDDIRLSMPPAETLTGKKVVVPGSATSVPPPSGR